jgi:cytochrome c oxidase assembly protein subunit 15
MATQESKQVLKQKSLAHFLILTILYILVVILWGAYVRATGSGAGCGSHWPLCNGQFIPVDPSLHTKIEFLHRLSSGLSIPIVAYGTWRVFQKFPPGTWIRKTSLTSLISIFLEAMIGAGLVLFELVSHDQSLKRTVSISLHFANTLILLSSLALTLMSLNRGGTGWSSNPERVAMRKPALLFALLFFCVGMAGAVTALGDTLFPAQSLIHGLEQDLNPASHFLIKLRVIHPILAVMFVALVTPWVFTTLGSTRRINTGKLLIVFLFANVAIGVWNLLSLAPISLQIFHLSMATTIWIVWVMYLDQLLAGE